MLVNIDLWQHILITLYRIILGLSAAFVLAISIGFFCSVKQNVIEYVSPFAFIIQACPIIIWISLLIIWAGTGSFVPILAVFLATFPILVINVIQGINGLDQRLFQMVHLYQVPLIDFLTEVVWGGIAGYVLAGLAISLSLAWKVASTAEFIGSSTGVGAQIYLSYKLLNIERLFAWALLLIIIGIIIDIFIVRRLRCNVDERMRLI
jgi:NitT/TauT family transport system permease protein